MADQSGAEKPSTGGSSTSARAGSAAQVDDSGRGNKISAVAGFRLPWPQGWEIDPARMLWWGGLAALAAVEIIEWPVALVVGAGSFVAERMAHQDAEKIAAQRS